MKFRLAIPSSDYTESQVTSSIMEILRKTKLFSMATVMETEQGPHSHISTAFYSYTSDFDFYILTGPQTQHGRNLAINDSIALAVFDSHQIWDGPKQGLQLFGTAKLANDAQLREGLELYLQQYPGLRRWVQTPEEIVKIDSRLYRIEISHIKVFDEPTFGTEVWIDVNIER